jgi:TP901 family phage tail tape measure protein
MITSLIGGAMGGAGINIVIRGINKYSGPLAAAKASTLSFKSVATSAFNAIAVGAGIAASAIVGISVKSVKAFANYEAKMADVSGIMGVGSDAMATFGDEVRRIATELPIQNGALAVSEGLYHTLSAGITDTAEATAFLEQATKTAVAGHVEMESAVKALASIMNAYNMESSDAQEVSDILFKTIDKGLTTFPEMADKLGRVTSVASQMEIPFEEVAAALATLTAGGQSTDEALTAIRAGFVQLLKPGSELQQVLDSIGYESVQAMIQAEGYSGALDLIHDHSVELKIPMEELFTNVRAMQSVLPLTGSQAIMFAENLAYMREESSEAGRTEEILTTQIDNLKASLQSLKNNLYDVGLEIGSKLVPYLEDLVDAIEPLWESHGPKVVEAFDNLFEALSGEEGVEGALGIVLDGFVWLINKLAEFIAKLKTAYHVYKAFTNLISGNEDIHDEHLQIAMQYEILRKNIAGEHIFDWEYVKAYPDKYHKINGEYMSSYRGETEKTINVYINGTDINENAGWYLQSVQ